MKILQINANYGFGSTGLIVKDIGTAIRESGNDAFFAYQNTNEEIKNGYKIGTYIDGKLHAILCRLFGKQGFYSRRVTFDFLKYVECIKPDVVHLHNLHSNYINLPILLEYLAQKNIPTVITMHDCWYFTGKCFHYVDCGCEKFKYGCGKCPKKMDPPASVLFDRTKEELKEKVELIKKIKRLCLVGCSEWICQETSKSLLGRCMINQIYNGVDTEIFKSRDRKAIKNSYGYNNLEIIMGMANKWLLFRNKKLLDKMVESLDDNQKLMIVGCTNRQINQLKEYGNKIISIGSIKDRNEIAELYCLADVFANPTHADTLPTVNMESICCGTPVVTYDVCGSPELIKDGCGKIVKEDDIESFVHFVQYLCKQKIRCSELAKDLFDKNKCYKKYIELYKKIST